MSEPLVCPICDVELDPHCGTRGCTWEKCPSCGYIGKPEGKWVPPLGRKDDDRR